MASRFRNTGSLGFVLVLLLAKFGSRDALSDDMSANDIAMYAQLRTTQAVMAKLGDQTASYIAPLDSGVQRRTISADGISAVVPEILIPAKKEMVSQLQYGQLSAGLNVGLAAGDAVCAFVQHLGCSAYSLGRATQGTTESAVGYGAAAKAGDHGGAVTIGAKLPDQLLEIGSVAEEMQRRKPIHQPALGIVGAWGEMTSGLKKIADGQFVDGFSSVGRAGAKAIGTLIEGPAPKVASSLIDIGENSAAIYSMQQEKSTGLRQLGAQAARAEQLAGRLQSEARTFGDIAMNLRAGPEGVARAIEDYERRYPGIGAHLTAADLATRASALEAQLRRERSIYEQERHISNYVAEAAEYGNFEALAKLGRANGTVNGLLTSLASDTSRRAIVANAASEMALRTKLVSDIWRLEVAAGSSGEQLLSGFANAYRQAVQRRDFARAQEIALRQRFALEQQRHREQALAEQQRRIPAYGYSAPQPRRPTIASFPSTYGQTPSSDGWEMGTKAIQAFGQAYIDAKRQERESRQQTQQNGDLSRCRPNYQHTWGCN